MQLSNDFIITATLSIMFIAGLALIASWLLKFAAYTWAQYIDRKTRDRASNQTDRGDDDDGGDFRRQQKFPPTATAAPNRRARNRQ